MSAFALGALSTFAARPHLLAGDADDSDDNRSILISDQFNNRVIEVDRRPHAIVWQFGAGKPGLHTVVGVNDAGRFGEFTLIPGTGIPPGNPPLPGCSNPVNGCPDNRVMIVNHDGTILWQHGQAGVAGSGPNQVNTPAQALFLLPRAPRPGCPHRGPSQPAHHHGQFPPPDHLAIRRHRCPRKRP